MLPIIMACEFSSKAELKAITDPMIARCTNGMLLKIDGVKYYYWNTNPPRFKMIIQRGEAKYEDVDDVDLNKC